MQSTRTSTPRCVGRDAEPYWSDTLFNSLLMLPDVPTWCIKCTNNNVTVTCMINNMWQYSQKHRKTCSPNYTLIQSVTYDRRQVFSLWCKWSKKSTEQQHVINNKQTIYIGDYLGFQFLSFCTNKDTRDAIFSFIYYMRQHSAIARPSHGWISRKRLKLG